MPIDKSQLVTKEDKERAIQEREIRTLAHESSAYLRETDWYIVRKHETGKDVPQEILQKRADARLAVEAGSSLG